MTEFNKLTKILPNKISHRFLVTTKLCTLYDFNNVNAFTCQCLAAFRVEQLSVLQQIIDLSGKKLVYHKRSSLFSGASLKKKVL